MEFLPLLEQERYRSIFRTIISNKTPTAELLNKVDSQGYTYIHHYTKMVMGLNHHENTMVQIVRTKFLAGRWNDLDVLTNDNLFDTYFLPKLNDQERNQLNNTDLSNFRNCLVSG